MATVRYGYSKNEFLGMTIKDLSPETEFPALGDVTTSAEAVVVASGVSKHRTKDGEILDVEVSSHLAGS